MIQEFLSGFGYHFSLLETCLPHGSASLASRTFPSSVEHEVLNTISQAFQSNLHLHCYAFTMAESKGRDLESHRCKAKPVGLCEPRQTIVRSIPVLGYGMRLLRQINLKVINSYAIKTYHCSAGPTSSFTGSNSHLNSSPASANISSSIPLHLSSE